MFRKTFIVLAACALGATNSSALADIDEACDEDLDGYVDDYNVDLTTEEAQQWNLANATSLAFTSSPLAAPRAYKAFQPVLSLELNQFDYLTCQERTVLQGAKSEDTNKTPVIPKLRLTLGLPLGHIAISGLPPVKINGVRTGALTVEAGGAFHLGDSGIKAGVRAHVTGGQIVGDIAHPFGVSPDDPDYDTLAEDDEYQFINYGADLSLSKGISLPWVELSPYVGGGVLSASSIFYVPETPFEVFAGDYFLDYQHDEIATETYEGFRGIDLFAGIGAAIPEMHIDGALEFFFIPVRAVIPEAYNTEEGLKSEYITNMSTIRVRIGYTF